MGIAVEGGQAMTDDIFVDDFEVQRQDSVAAGLDTFGLAHVSASQISQYQRCPRQWAYRYVMGLRTPPDGGLLVGSGVHRAAEVAMIHKRDKGEAMPTEDVVDVAAGYISDSVAGGEVRLAEDQQPGSLVDKAARIARVWSDEAAPLVEPLEVEQQFDIVLAGVPVTGRMDVVTATGVVDWKTSGKAPNADDAARSVQTELYAAATGKPVEYVYLVDQVKGTRVIPVDIGAEASAHAAGLAEDTVRDTAEGMALGVWPRNRQGWHCSEKWCGFHDRCMAGRDDALLRERAEQARAAAGVMW